MIEEFLQKIGFSEKESAIYIHLLKMDQDSIANIAKATTINRTTVYPILDSLVKNEFVEEISIDEKSMYRARTPDRIESYLQEQKIKIEEQAQQAKDIIPQMKGIMREDGQRPIIEYGEGREEILKAIKSYYSSTETDGEVLMIYPRDKIEVLFTEKERSFAKSLRLSKNIKTKSIYTYSKGDYNPDSTGTRFHIDEKEYPINADISIFNDRVRIHTLGDNLSTIGIRSKDFADTLRTLFKLAIKGIEK